MFPYPVYTDVAISDNSWYVCIFMLLYLLFLHLIANHIEEYNEDVHAMYIALQQISSTICQRTSVYQMQASICQYVSRAE